MKSIKHILRRWALASAAATSLFAGQALALPTITVNPSTQTIAIGQMASVDIVVSGLDQPVDAVGGFSLTLNFNSTFLDGVGFTLDPGARMGTFDVNNDFSGGFSGGSLDLFYIANVAEDQDSLAAAQGESFILATVQFEGAANGLSPLRFPDGVTLSNWNGDETRFNVDNPGEICVAAQGGVCAPTSVPEPATMLLVASALGAMALRRRRPEQGAC